MANRSGDWMAQAERDLEQALSSRREVRHEWACFASHQSAEKAVEALHLHLGQEAWGHVVARLLLDLPSPPDPDLVDRAKVLDNFYILTRYPNGFDQGAPMDYFGKEDAEKAISDAEEILDYVRGNLHRS